jgi:hypothetical protein
MSSITTHNFTIQENTMKSLRRLFGASVLILTFALFTSAGEMSTPLAPPQPAPTPAQAQGEITTGVAGDISTTEATADVVLAEAVVDLVQGVLALL